MLRNKFVILQLHHLWIGIILLAVSICLIATHHLPCLAWLLGFAGLVMVIDDANEHWGNGHSVLYDIFQWAWRGIFKDKADAIWQRIFGGLK